MITFLVPTYNENLNIEIFVSKIQQLNLKQPYNIFFVDDDSKDGSILKFKEIKKNNKNIDFYIRKNSKRDLTHSIIEGLKFIKTKYIFVLDCDLQHDVNAIPKMINILIDENYDLVIGSRNINKINSIKRRYISFFGIWITKLLGIQRLTDPLSGFFGLRTSDFINIAPKIQTRGYKILLSIIFFLSNNKKIKEVTINFYERKYEKSKLNYKVIFLFFIQILHLILLNISKVLK